MQVENVKMGAIGVGNDGVLGEAGLFKSAEEMLSEATEVLRVRRFPQISKAYLGEVRQRIVGNDGAPVGEERHAGALSVYQCIHCLPMEDQELLTLHMWGDYATPARLRAAEEIQERYRRAGKRVRLAHRYSLRQLAPILGVGKTTVARRLEKAFVQLQAELERVGLIEEG